jgi:Lon protease-like protein
MTLPEVVPLFPLPNVVLFPRMPLPLHVFEPRYRAMVRDALRGPRLVGMVLLRGDWKPDYAGRPPIFTTGTVGQIVHVEELPDGRYNLVLRGVAPFVVREELPPAQLYRQARVAWRADVDDPLPAPVRDAVLSLVRRYLERVGRRPVSPAALDRDVDDGAFVNFFAQHLDLDPLEKQALLEESATSARGARLVDVLEFRLEELARAGGGPQGRAH